MINNVVEPPDRSDIVPALSSVRLMAELTIATVWFSEARNGLKLARRYLGRQEALGFASQTSVVAYPFSPVATGPLFSWPQCQDLPADELSYELSKRRRKPPHRFRAYIATEKAADMFGGHGGALKRPLQSNHDLLVGCIWAHLYLFDRESTRNWVGEDALRWHRRAKRPDAVIYEEEEGQMRPRLIVESGGVGYSPDRIREHFQWAVERNIPWTLW